MWGKLCWDSSWQERAIIMDMSKIRADYIPQSINDSNFERSDKAGLVVTIWRERSKMRRSYPLVFCTSMVLGKSIMKCLLIH